MDRAIAKMIDKFVSSINPSIARRRMRLKSPWMITFRMMATYSTPSRCLLDTAPKAANIYSRRNRSEVVCRIRESTF